MSSAAVRSFRLSIHSNVFRRVTADGSLYFMRADHGVSFRIYSLLADPMHAADLHHRVAGLPPYPQNLLFTMTALAHIRLSLRFQRTITTKILNFNPA
jgi:hypothetical protein